MTGTIQGSNAVLMLYKNAFVPFLCASDISIALTSDELPIRTLKHGHWKNVTYKNASYNVSLSGLVKFDNDTAWTSWDMIDNWLNFAAVKFRISFDDLNGDIRSVQGFAIITGNTLSWSAGSLVKTDIGLSGTGELKVFDGLIACQSTITGISVAGQTGGTGTVTITYTYTGAPYQVKYRLNGTGAYSYALLGISIVIPTLTAGSYSVEIIPVCANGYESDNSASQAFIVTRAGTCSATVSSIGTSGGSLTPVFTGTPSTWKYSIDGGAYTVVSIFITSVNISGLAVGAHTVSVIPTCSNGVDGTGILNQAFTVSATPTQSIIQWSLFSITATDNVLEVWVNGVLNVVINGSGTHSGSITAPIGATVMGRLSVNNVAGQNGTLTTTDNTTSVTLDTRSGGVPSTLSYSFIANGDTFGIGGSIL